MLKINNKLNIKELQHLKLIIWNISQYSIQYSIKPVFPFSGKATQARRSNYKISMDAHASFTSLIWSYHAECMQEYAQWIIFYDYRTRKKIKNLYFKTGAAINNTATKIIMKRKKKHAEFVTVIEKLTLTSLLNTGEYQGSVTNIKTWWCTVP